MDEALREEFDSFVNQVVEELPDQLTKLLDETPLIVEDEPARHVLDALGVDRAELCGLFSGVALTDRSPSLPFEPPTSVYIYRLGVRRLAAQQSRLRRSSRADELRRQIRITVLHELGHLHGLDEGDLARLGYG
ncbi:MAG: metallopeptidase family protein [Pirellulaceae bacterium]|nr:metallopeptidase family protein [Pirellulaceae bacterium]